MSLRTVLLAGIVTLVGSSAVLAGNTATIVQSGRFNEAFTAQRGFSNTSTTVQYGTVNRAVAVQRGPSNDGAIGQSGRFNSSKILQMP